MSNKEILIIADYTDETPLTLDELCELAGLHGAELQEFIAYDILIPTGESPNEWQFDLLQVQRLKTALRLQRDLEVNMAGIALVLDLLEEIEEQRARADMFEKLLKG